MREKNPPKTRKVGMWDTEFLFNRHVSGISESMSDRKGQKQFLKTVPENFLKLMKDIKNHRFKKHYKLK